MSTVDLEAKIPNNVNLKENKRLMRALEKWQPGFLDWWGDMGPTDFNADQTPFARDRIRMVVRSVIVISPRSWMAKSAIVPFGCLGSLPNMRISDISQPEGLWTLMKEK